MNIDDKNIILLNDESDEIKYLCSKDKRLAKLISIIGPISYSTYKDPYVFIVHEIIEQMLSIKAATKIFERLENLCEGNISPATINSLTDEQIKSIGTSNSKVSFIRAVTNAVETKELDFSVLPTLSDKEAFSALTKVRGIGKWTAKMYLMFVLNRQDVLPAEDAAFLQAYKWLYKRDNDSKEEIEKRCKKWKPYSSIASRYLYRALDSGLTKEEFHLYK